VGIPLLAGIGVGRSSFGRRQIGVFLAAPPVIHLLAFYQQFRRYAISGDTTWWVFRHPRWQPPPAPFADLLEVHVVLVIALFAWLAVLAHRSARTTTASRVTAAAR
jgi:hypothetical protein